jgi:aspartyl-tRNA(Asn)/glutamyl-tRNA(Gln) amidotransferase subunit A
MAMPAGFTTDGLPLSLQLVGHPWQEAMIYRIGRAYEQATRWIDRRPPGL